MTRAAHLLLTTTFVFALGCSHEASAPSALRDAPGTAPTLATVAPPEAPPALAAESAAPPCIDIDEAASGKHITLEGRLFVDELYEHPARGKTHPYILRLDAPRCAIGTEEARVSELHLASVDGVPLKAFVGKRVRVSGDPFGAHTAWHARPVVLMTTKATPLY